MRTWILTLSIVVMVLDAHGSLRARIPEVPVRSPRSLRQQVDSYTEMLEKEVAKAKTSKEKFRSLARVLAQIRGLRENSSPQGALDETHMDLVLSALESLPRESRFKKKDCPKYESELIDQFEPATEDAPQEPAVKPSWAVLQSLCQS